MAVSTYVVTTQLSGTGTHTLNATCRKVTLISQNGAATLAVTGTAVLLPQDTPVVIEDKNLGGTDLTIGGTVTTIGVIEEIGLGG